MRLGERLFDAYLVCLAVLLGELCAVAIFARSELASASELLLALRGLGPIAAVSVAPIAALCGAFVEGVARSTRPLPRALVGASAAIFGALVGFGVACGRRFDGVTRPLFAIGVGAVVGVAVFVLAPRISRAVGAMDAKRRALVVTGTALAVAIVAEVANHRILPRLYPAFHTGHVVVAVASASFVTLAYGPLDRTGRATRAGLSRAIGALVVFTVSAALVPSSASRVALADNVRIVFVDHAPALGKAVELAALIEPPEPLDPAVAAGPTDTGGKLDLTGWDLLVVTVDALRADHVGAYGYGRPTTPEIDALAKEGAVFDAAYTATPHTSYAITSLMTGKFMRPLLAMDLGADSETFPEHLRRYGYKTAAFYPPAVFFIDESRFVPFSEKNLGFEYARVEFLPAAERTAQVETYLDGEAGDGRVFLWVHLFEPHEPYESHANHEFGARDIDRYDSEIAEADAAVGALVRAVRARRPKTMVVIAADHGEEFGEHGGRYHGTTVYEEQVRVPLVVNAPGLVAPRRIAPPASLVDVLPTTLSGLGIPRPARVRGRDLGGLLTADAPKDAPGFAFAETEEMAMLARDRLRLVCVRKASACALYDLEDDPAELRDAASRKPEAFSSMRSALRSLDASHGRFEREGLTKEGRTLPEPIRRGLGGDVDAAPDIATLLDDADVSIRRKAAEVLFDLRRKEVAPALRLAMTREDDAEARAFIALALTRLGEGAPLTFELLHGDDVRLQRLAALALAESGDLRGEDVLIAWVRAAFPKDGKPAPADEIPFERAREVVDAVASTKSDEAVGPLLYALRDVRLRPYVARALARIGEDAARPALAARLMEERYVPSRVAITEALLDLGAGPELRDPLVSMLGMPDPLPNGLDYARRGEVLRFVGGPSRDGEEKRLERFATSGVAVDFVVPEMVKGAEPPPGATAEVRVICRARAPKGGEIRLGPRLGLPSGPEKKAPIPSDLPALDASRAVTLRVPESESPMEVFADMPKEAGIRLGKQTTLVVYATQLVEVQACALVPLRGELPPPPKEPWSPDGHRD
ncbi:MAG TPA: sulfatase-like hydrolase/transferase [Polyangiaceae bacterium]|nr:sulfatase-like hydrolase/transferase [Polyangiaceae bacterium]